MAVSHPDECGGESRLARGGVGVKIDVGGQGTWIVSVHMKAACRGNSNESRTPTHCATQRAQFNALNTWIRSRPSGDAVIIAGDLNRNLLDQNDRIRREIFQLISPNIRFLPWGGAKPRRSAVAEVEATSARDDKKIKFPVT
jgi:hypothetical protein